MTTRSTRPRHSIVLIGLQLGVVEDELDNGRRRSKLKRGEICLLEFSWEQPNPLPGNTAY